MFNLQQILGTDKHNPSFTLCRDPETPGIIYVYFGMRLLQTVPDDPDSPEFRMAAAQLYNAGFKRKTLIDVFHIDLKTLQKWGDALKSNYPEVLVRTLSGKKTPRKLTTEVVSFVMFRFRGVYPENKYSYSKQIRADILEVFKFTVSGETLRPIFYRLRKEFSAEQATGPESQKKESTCDSTAEPPPDDELLSTDKIEESEVNAIEPESQIRSQSPSFFTNGSSHYFHHLGVLIFSGLLAGLTGFFEGKVLQMLRQWLFTVLLDAANIEQTKLLDFDSLNAFVRTTVPSLHAQRLLLSELATPENILKVRQYNAHFIDAAGETDFYYDPHSKQYTGKQNVLKGWCPGIRSIGKVLHGDYIHTGCGVPVFGELTDNFHDMRDRFPSVIDMLRTVADIPASQVLTFVVDRGIYKEELFEKLAGTPNRLITWEKGYKKSQWKESGCVGEFIIGRPRNNSRDLKFYRFRFMDETWPKNASMRRLIVQATNPKERTIEVSILAHDKERDAREIISLMFRRWLQENDFKYLNLHFGINEITSYRAESYKRLAKAVEDRQMKSGEYKALELTRNRLERSLGKLLVSKLKGRKSWKREEKVTDLMRKIGRIEGQLSETQKEVSRLETMIKKENVRMKTDAKSFMDAVKILAHNLFYQAFVTFHEYYDNYRDDHEMFRNLTHAHGCAVFGQDEVSVFLIPTVRYQPRLRLIVESVLENLNELKPVLPDDSGRTIRFFLTDKEGIRLANVKAENERIY